MCMLRCRLFVKQQQQAVKVHDPLVLAEDFEALIGTSGYILSIAQTRQDLSDKTKTSEVLQASLHRQVFFCCTDPSVMTSQALC